MSQEALNPLDLSVLNAIQSFADLCTWNRQGISAYQYDGEGREAGWSNVRVKARATNTIVRT